MKKLNSGGILLLLIAMSLTSFGQVNLSLLGQLSYGPNLSDIWGYSDGVNEYALVGVQNGTSIVDVTNPAAPSQVQFVSGSSSTWRDIKTWGNYAYVTNETGGGLAIIDLSGLPGSAPSTSWTGGPNPLGGSVSFSTAHNIFIDENGIGYIVGANYASGGAIMIDLDANPINPPIVGVYNTNYCHDIYVRNDIMYTAEIYAGQFAIVDISNKLSPNVIATQSTPSNFTHNTWLSDDGNTLFTTDETSNASVTSFDISDPTDINQLDRLFSGGSNAIPHNTFVNGDFLVTAHYTDGVRIADASDPANLVETGFFDTSPSSGSGYNGCWGVYPYLPSGIILATDQSQGLFILNPTYSYALRLQGTVTDASTGGLLFGANVEVVGSSSTTTDLFGQYSTGVAIAGTYTVNISAAGYQTETITGVSITSGVTTLDASLTPFPGASNCTGYCPAGGNTTVDEWIETVVIGPLTNNSGDNDGYINFTGGFTTMLEQGGTYSVNLLPGFAGITYNEYWQIWIDLNRDGTYAGSEKVFDSGSATSSAVSGSINIPSSTGLGYTGMRVMMSFSGAENQCGAFTYGEVEDYCVELIPSGGTTCNPPANPTVDNVTGNGVAVSWDAVPGAIMYQAQGRKAGTGSFRQRNSSTTSLTVNSLASGTTYDWQVRVQCADGSISAWGALGSFTTLSPRLDAGNAVLFPNPASDLVTVSGLPAGSVFYQLYDMTGRMLKQGIRNSTSGVLGISVRTLPSGAYLLKWEGPETSGNFNLIVE